MRNFFIDHHAEIILVFKISCRMLTSCFIQKQNAKVFNSLLCGYEGNNKESKRENITV